MSKKQIISKKKEQMTEENIIFSNLDIKPLHFYAEI